MDAASGMRQGPNLAIGGQGTSLQDLLANRDPGQLSDRYSATDANPKSSGLPSRPSLSTKSRRRQAEEDEEAKSVKMIRPPNPYADIPSLYDMYVQAAAWQRPAERFGLDVFRNTENDPDIIPMDLPVGPDYVVGPGDSLSIDLGAGFHNG
jgi:hypothetical protein